MRQQQDRETDVRDGVRRGRERVAAGLARLRDLVACEGLTARGAVERAAGVLEGVLEALAREYPLGVGESPRRRAELMWEHVAGMEGDDGGGNAWRFVVRVFDLCGSFRGAWTDDGAFCERACASLDALGIHA